MESLYHALNSIDVVGEIEKQVGAHHSEFTDAENIAMLGASMRHSRAKKAALEANNDTHFSMTVDAYRKVIHQMGFELAALFDIQHKDYRGEARDEKLYVYGHRTHGIVLKFDSYSWGDSVVNVNGGNWYAAFRPDSRDSIYGRAHLSSGGWESESETQWRIDPKYEHSGQPDDLFWFGHWDCREGVRAHISSLLQHGKLLPQWPKLRKPYLPIFVSGHDYYSETYERLKDARNYSAGSEYIAHVNRTRALEAPEWLLGIINNEL
ncbi:hypothetical protein QF001_000879 [Paraburkholderia youngii]|uniref:hypothetical protein n=1 Tax=Paraburkholderia youngii TaxID=2782701 RepID=UPI003D1A3102